MSKIISTKSPGVRSARPTFHYFVNKLKTAGLILDRVGWWFI
jgi:hypothetical protein